VDIRNSIAEDRKRKGVVDKYGLQISPLKREV
jgi:hypothetical protein